MPTAPRSYRPPGAPTAKGYDRARGSATGRGYDADWRRLRAAHLSGEPLCRHCMARGLVRPADLVDHIDPFDGPADPRRLDAANLQSLCAPCHNRKTAHDGSRG